MIERKLDKNFFLIVLMLGMALNFMVYSANGYMMSVKTEQGVEF